MGVVHNLVCERVRSQISLELDGGLSELERMMVFRHVEHCSSCGAFRDGATTVAEQMRREPLEPFRVPIVLPRIHRGRLIAARDVAVRATAAAAGLALVLGLAFSERGVLPSAQSSTPRSAYLDSPSGEQALIRQLSEYRLIQQRSDIRPI